MNVFKKINLFLFRIDGIISLAISVLAFLGLVQCVLGVQAGITLLTIPCFALLITFVQNIVIFLDWTIYASGKTRVKMVELKAKQLYDVWEVPYEE